MSAISALTIPASYTPKPSPTPVPPNDAADPDGGQGAAAAPAGRTGQRVNLVA
jgi:hypothetical protein